MIEEGTASDWFNLARWLLDEKAASWGSKPALYCQGQTLSYAELADRVVQAAHLLSSIGLGRGDRVLIAAADGFGFAIGWLGTVRAGGVAVAIPPSAKQEELAFYLSYSQATVLIADPSLAAALADTASSPKVLWLDESFEDQLKNADPLAPLPPTTANDPAAWLFTSGSTGQPKAAVHRHRDFAFSAQAYAQAAIGYRSDDIALSTSKLAFGYALGTSLLFPLAAGGAAILFPEKATPERALALVKAHRPTIFSAVPTSLCSLLSLPDLCQADFSSVRFCISAGESLAEGLKRRFEERTGVELVDGLGAAETFHIFISNRKGRTRPGSIGQVVDGYQVKVCDEEGRTLPPGELGMLWVKGGSVAREYWDNPDASRRTFRDGWYASADLVSCDREGFFYFRGRADEMIKVSGKWVSPTEVEQALLAHPAIEEAAVVPFTDPDGLEKPRAFVVANREAQAPLLDELRTHLSARLPPYKVPRELKLVPALPRSERGKVLKSLLRE